MTRRAAVILLLVLAVAAWIYAGWILAIIWSPDKDSADIVYVVYGAVLVLVGALLVHRAMRLMKR